MYIYTYIYICIYYICYILYILVIYNIYIFTCQLFIVNNINAVRIALLCFADCVLTEALHKKKFHFNRVYVGSSHPKRGMIELFVENLPGYVNNIRRTQRGTLWVGLQSARYKGRPNILDRYGQKPFIRSVIMKVS